MRSKTLYKSPVYNEERDATTYLETYFQQEQADFPQEPEYQPDQGTEYQSREPQQEEQIHEKRQFSMMVEFLVISNQGFSHNRNQQRKSILTNMVISSLTISIQEPLI
jgi:hypothetical protein